MALTETSTSLVIQWLLQPHFAALCKQGEISQDWLRYICASSHDRSTFCCQSLSVILWLLHSHLLPFVLTLKKQHTPWEIQTVNINFIDWWGCRARKNLSHLASYDHQSFLSVQSTVMVKCPVFSAAATEQQLHSLHFYLKACWCDLATTSGVKNEIYLCLRKWCNCCSYSALTYSNLLITYCCNL